MQRRKAPYQYYPQKHICDLLFSYLVPLTKAEKVTFTHKSALFIIYSQHVSIITI